MEVTEALYDNNAVSIDPRLDPKNIDRWFSTLDPLENLKTVFVMDSYVSKSSDKDSVVSLDRESLDFDTKLLLYDAVIQRYRDLMIQRCTDMVYYITIYGRRYLQNSVQLDILLDYFDDHISVEDYNTIIRPLAQYRIYLYVLAPLVT